MSTSVFDPGRPYRRSPSVALRPEPFGALVYHFGTRKLSFLKTPELAAVVTDLERHADVHAALSAAGVDGAQRPAYLRALAGLAANGTITERGLSEREFDTERGLSEREFDTERGLSEREIDTERGLSEREFDTERGLSEREIDTERGLSEREFDTERGLSEREFDEELV